MNSNTRDALKAFIEQVEVLAQGVVQMTGTQDCGKLIDAGEDLKNQLDSDETII